MPFPARRAEDLRMTTQSFMREEARELTWGWWLLVLTGVLSIAAGVIVLGKPGDSLATLAVISGIFLLVDGIFELAVSLMRTTANRGLTALLGVLTVIVGVMLIRHPIAGVAAIALLIGIWLISIGVVRFVAAFGEENRRGWQIAAAVIEVIAGIVIVSSPDIGFATLALLTGIAFIVNGIGLIALGWSMHKLRTAVTAPAAQPAQPRPPGVRAGAAT
jgi:uncharacterized membrane protein HdeD (DUF308 family)